LQLRGTLFTRNLKPIAIIEDTRTGQTTMYEQGDALEGSRIVNIIRGEVTLSTLAGEYKLSFPEGAVLQPKTASGGPLATGKNWYNIRREGDTYIVDEATVFNTIQRIPEIIKNVKIGPCFKDGKPSGIIINKLIPIDILKEIGVKEGDVIKNINGFTLNNPHQVFLAYNSLKEQKAITLNVIRDNRPLKLNYKIVK
jgi:general secretion pathway protein C